MNWKTMPFSTTILLIGFETCLMSFLRRGLFCSPRLVYQIFSWRSSTTVSAWFCKPGLFQTDFQFSRFLIVAFNYYQLAFRISQASTIQNWLGSDFNIFSVFGLVYKHLVRFGDVKATFWCELMELRIFQSLLVWWSKSLIVMVLWFQFAFRLSHTYSWND